MGGFANPTKQNAETEQYVEGKNRQTIDENAGTTATAQGETSGLMDEMINTPGQSLHRRQNYNLAKGEGDMGMINNRDYSTTLRLARQADRYNSRPQEHFLSIGTRKTGGVKDRGTLHERPQLNTMEQRAMNQSFQLDTNQKTLAQSLQDAVNRKDLNAFMLAYQQKFGITLTKMQAEIEMRKYTRQLEMQQMTTKTLQEYSGLLNQYLGARAASIIKQIAIEDPLLASFMGYTITGGPAPSMDDIQSQQFIIEYMKKELGPNWQSATPEAQIKARSEAERALNTLYYIQDEMSEAELLGATGLAAHGARKQAKKAAKATAKAAGGK